MDQQRPFLYLSLFFLGFLIWSTWQQDHAPKAPVSKTEATLNNSTIPSASTPTNAAIAPTQMQVHKRILQNQQPLP